MYMQCSLWLALSRPAPEYGRCERLQNLLNESTAGGCDALTNDTYCCVLPCNVTVGLRGRRRCDAGSHLHCGAGNIASLREGKQDFGRSGRSRNTSATPLLRPGADEMEEIDTTWIVLSRQYCKCHKEHQERPELGQSSGLRLVLAAAGGKGLPALCLSQHAIQPCL